MIIVQPVFVDDAYDEAVLILNAWDAKETCIENTKLTLGSVWVRPEAMNGIEVVIFVKKFSDKIFSEVPKGWLELYTKDEKRRSYIKKCIFLNSIKRGNHYSYRSNRCRGFA